MSQGGSALVSRVGVPVCACPGRPVAAATRPFGAQSENESITVAGDITLIKSHKKGYNIHG